MHLDIATIAELSGGARLGVSAARRERGDAFCAGTHPPTTGGGAARQNRRQCPDAPFPGAASERGHCKTEHEAAPLIARSVAS